MQVGQRIGVGQPGRLRHEALDQVQHPVGSVDEAAHHLARIRALLAGAVLV